MFRFRRLQRSHFLHKQYLYRQHLYLSIQKTESDLADHSWRQMNHIWNQKELEQQRKTSKKKHVPKTVSDKLAFYFMKTLYHSFNFITGYREKNPSPQSLEWRLIILESFAGVPGFIAAGFRHFHSLRNLKRDHGAIFTFLEEAENERMHLLVCLKMFQASFLTKILVIMAQITMTPILMIAYIIHPRLLHRFVAYLEETAVHTYANILDHMETKGTLLHKEWKNLPAPDIAKSYWNLDNNAQWEDCLRHMLADEAHHRNVNHTFAELPRNAPNPFIEEHYKNFDAAVRRKYKVIETEYKESNDALYK